MLRKFPLLLIASWAYSLIPAAYAENKAGIDYDIASGRKPLKPLVVYSSKLPFNPTFEDITAYYSNLKPQSLEADGKVLNLKLIAGTLTRHEFNDLDGSGKFEQWKEYDSGSLHMESRIDEQTGLIIDQTVFDSDGNIIEVRTDSAKKGFFDERSLYRNGKILKTLRDKDGDSLFEEELIYFHDKNTKGTPELPQVLQIDPGIRFYVAGFFRHSERVSLDTELTRKVIERFGKKSLNTPEQSKQWFEALIKKNPKRRFVNRFELYNTILKEASGKTFDTYILSGDVYRDDAKILISFRLLGPTPVDKVGAGFISLSSADYEDSKVSEKINDIIQKKLERTEVGTITRLKEDVTAPDLKPEKSTKKKKKKSRKKKKRK